MSRVLALLLGALLASTLTCSANDATTSLEDVRAEQILNEERRLFSVLLKSAIENSKEIETTLVEVSRRTNRKYLEPFFSYRIAIETNRNIPPVACSLPLTAPVQPTFPELNRVPSTQLLRLSGLIEKLAQKLGGSFYEYMRNKNMLSQTTLNIRTYEDALKNEGRASAIAPRLKEEKARLQSIEAELNNTGIALARMSGAKAFAEFQSYAAKQ